MGVCPSCTKLPQISLKYLEVQVIEVCEGYISNTSMMSIILYNGAEFYDTYLYTVHLFIHQVQSM